MVFLHQKKKVSMVLVFSFDQRHTFLCDIEVTYVEPYLFGRIKAPHRLTV